MKKRIVSVILAAMMALSLAAGCGTKDDGVTKDANVTNEQGKDSQETPEDTKEPEGTGEPGDAQGAEGDTSSVLKDGNVQELLMLLPGPTSSPDHMQDVEDRMNEIIAKTIDAKIKIQILEWGNWVDQVNLMMSGGEKLDLLVYANPALISNMAQRGQLLSLEDYAPTYAKEALEASGKYLDACYVGDTYYGMPTFRDLATSGGITCRKDWLEESGMKVEDIKTWDDIETLYDKVKEKHPDAYMGVGNLHAPVLTYAGLYFDGPGAGVGCRMDDNDGHIDIVNTYASRNIWKWRNVHIDGIRRDFLFRIPPQIIRSLRIGSAGISAFHPLEACIRDLLPI